MATLSMSTPRACRVLQGSVSTAEAWLGLLGSSPFRRPALFQPSPCSFLKSTSLKCLLTQHSPPGPHPLGAKAAGPFLRPLFPVTMCAPSIEWLLCGSWQHVGSLSNSPHSPEECTTTAAGLLGQRAVVPQVGSLNSDPRNGNSFPKAWAAAYDQLIASSWLCGQRAAERKTQERICKKWDHPLPFVSLGL